MEAKRERYYPRYPGVPTRADFKPDEFSQAIRIHGVDLWWEKSTLCACSNNAQTGQAQTGCPVCYGIGYEYWGGQELRGIVDAMDLHRDTQTAFGQWAWGMATITMESAYLPNFRDRITNLTAVLRYSEKRTRRAAPGVLERLQYQIAERRDLTLYPDDPKPAPANPFPSTYVDNLDQPVSTYVAQARNQQVAETIARDSVPEVRVPLSVLRMRKMDPLTRSPVDYILQQGVDFEVQAGRINWALGDALGTAPALGDLFAVEYLYHPRYIVEAFNHAARDQYLLPVCEPAVCVPNLGGIPKNEVLTRLPIEVIAKLDVLREESPGA